MVGAEELWRKPNIFSKATERQGHIQETPVLHVKWKYALRDRSVCPVLLKHCCENRHLHWFATEAGQSRWMYLLVHRRSIWKENCDTGLQQWKEGYLLNNSSAATIQAIEWQKYTNVTDVYCSPQSLTDQTTFCCPCRCVEAVERSRIKCSDCVQRDRKIGQNYETAL